jgi:uncharacterized protein YkwD
VRFNLRLLFALLTALAAFVAPVHASNLPFRPWPPGVAPESDLADTTLTEQAFLDLVNADRQSNGLAPLAFDVALLPVARARAASQLTDGPLSHLDASGGLAFVPLLADVGVSYVLAGENLARTVGSDGSVLGRVETALMQSPTHRKNILEPGFNRIAIGVAVDPGTGYAAYAQIFADEP